MAKQFPWPLNVGSRQRVFHLVKGIAAGHSVSMIALDAPPSQAALDEFVAASGCTRVTCIPRPKPVPAPASGVGRQFARAARAGRAVTALVASPLPSFVRENWSDDVVHAIGAAAHGESVDLVYATQSWMAEHAKSAGLSPIAVDVDDLISLMSRQRLATAPRGLRSRLAGLEADKGVAYERSLPRRFARVVVAKNEDREFFPLSDRERVHVVPNGISIPTLPLPEPTVANRLLFIGTLGYEPNIDAIRWFATDVLPRIWARRPDTMFDVAGFGSGSAVEDVLSDPRCSLSESPPDLTPFYSRAAVVVAPIRIGGGTRIKILEALARGRAVVSTEFAAEGLGLRGDTDLVFANRPDEIAEQCIQLLDSPIRRGELAAIGRESVAARFDWQQIERTLPALIETAVRSRSNDAQRN